MIKSVDGGDERDSQWAIGSPAEPGWNTAVSVKDGGGEIRKQTSEVRNPLREREGVFGAKVEGDVSSAVLFNF